MTQTDARPAQRPNASIMLGVLDWGIGGLGVVSALRARGLSMPIVYVSDTGVTAYGKLPRHLLARRVNTMIDVLHQRGATHILIACNAASTVISDLHTTLPVTGTIEPSLRAFSSLAPTRIGVIGGARTIRAGIHRRGLAAQGHRVMQRIAQPLSAHIERATIDTELGRRDLVRIVTPLRHVHTLVLACTHYPSITPQLCTLLPGVRLFDPALAVANSLADSLGHGVGANEIELFCTGDARAMRQAATSAWRADPGVCRPFSAT